MKKQFDLMDIFEGYVRNYRRINLHQATNKSMFTKREIDYFANLGELLGFFSFVEDTKPNYEYGRSRPMDLAWWKSEPKIDKENFSQLILHLERENIWSKDAETIEKLFCKTDEEYRPVNIIGIQNVENYEKIRILNEMVCKKNKVQDSNVLMIYRYYDEDEDFDKVAAYYILENKIVGEKHAICDIDKSCYWTMCFNEEYEG